MTKALRFAPAMIAGALCLSLAGPAMAAGDAPTWVTPVIEGYGSMHPLPNAAIQPQPGETYKIVFNVTKGGDMEGVNTALWHIARAVNLYGNAGVDQTHRKFVAVIHGPATKVVLNNEAYKAKFGKDNPNLALIDALDKAGVKLLVCGQALADNSIDPSQLNPKVTLTLSALADLPILQANGYTLFPM